MATGSNIRRLRERKAWTQQDLADKSGISLRSVQRAEEGTTSADTLKAIALALEQPVETLSKSTHPTISPVVYYDQPSSIDWLVQVLGFEVRMKVPGPGGQIVHGELTFDDALVMIGTSIGSEGWHTPAQLDGRITQSLYVMVNDVHAHHAHAIEQGGLPQSTPEDAHGQRRYQIVDPEGHLWWFVQELN